MIDSNLKEENIMEEITMKTMSYIKSETVRLQGNDEKTKQHTRNGYDKIDNCNRNRVFSKPSQVLVTFTNGDLDQTINMKNEILEHYNRSQMTDKLAVQFRKDVNDGQILFEIDQYGHIHLKK